MPTKVEDTTTTTTTAAVPAPAPIAPINPDPTAPENIPVVPANSNAPIPIPSVSTTANTNSQPGIAPISQAYPNLVPGVNAAVVEEEACECAVCPCPAPQPPQPRAFLMNMVQPATPTTVEAFKPDIPSCGCLDKPVCGCRATLGYRNGMKIQTSNAVSNPGLKIEAGDKEVTIKKVSGQTSCGCYTCPCPAPIRSCGSAVCPNPNPPHVQIDVRKKLANGKFSNLYPRDPRFQQGNAMQQDMNSVEFPSELPRFRERLAPVIEATALSFANSNPNMSPTKSAVALANANMNSFSGAAGGVAPATAIGDAPGGDMFAASALPSSNEMSLQQAAIQTDRSIWPRTDADDVTAYPKPDFMPTTFTPIPSFFYNSQPADPISACGCTACPCPVSVCSCTVCPCPAPLPFPHLMTPSSLQVVADATDSCGCEVCPCPGALPDNCNDVSCPQYMTSQQLLERQQEIREYLRSKARNTERDKLHEEMFKHQANFNAISRMSRSLRWQYYQIRQNHLALKEQISLNKKMLTNLRMVDDPLQITPSKTGSIQPRYDNYEKLQNDLLKSSQYQQKIALCKFLGQSHCDMKLLYQKLYKSVAGGDAAEGDKLGVNKALKKIKELRRNGLKKKKLTPKPGFTVNDLRRVDDIGTLRRLVLDDDRFKEQLPNQQTKGTHERQPRQNSRGKQQDQDSIADDQHKLHQTNTDRDNKSEQLKKLLEAKRLVEEEKAAIENKEKELRLANSS